MNEKESQSGPGKFDAVDLSEKSFDDLLSLAMAAANDVELDFVVKVCDEMSQRFPEHAEQYFVLGVTALRLDDEGQAIAYFERAHNMDPDCREYAEALSNMYMRTGRLTDGTYYAKLAIAGDSNPMLGSYMPAKLSNLAESMAAVKPSMHFVEASRLYNLRKLAQAAKECSAEIRLNRDHFEAYILLAKINIDTKKYNKALGALQAAAQLRPTDNHVQAMMARVLASLGRFTEADALAERAIAKALEELEPEDHGMALDALLRNPDVDKENVTKLADAFEAAFFEDNPAQEVRESIGASRDVPRIGVFSNSFYRSPVAERVVPWFQTKIKRAHWLGYQQSVLEDIYTTLLKRGAEEWREIFDLDSYTLAYTMSGEVLDAVIDLCTLTGDTKFALAALRPANIRVGVFTLTDPGMAPGITHVLTDKVMAPGDEAWLRDGQALVTLDHSLYTRVPYKFEPEETETPAAGEGTITFGGVIEPSNLSPETACLWAEVLLAVPGSKLLLIMAEEYGPEVRDRVRDTFAALGVAGRISFTLGEDDTLTAAPDGEEEDADAPIVRPDTYVPPVYWTGVDIFLDTSPLNCIEETLEALWSGVPVVTLAGPRRPSRAGASILTAADKPEWIAETPSDYIAIATGLASDVAELSKTRAALLESIKGASVFDHGAAGNEIAEALGNLALTQFAKRIGGA